MAVAAGALSLRQPPCTSAAAQRNGAEGKSALVLKTKHVGQAGRQTVVRVMSGEIQDGDAITLPDGTSERVAGIFSLHGESQHKIDKAVAGDVAEEAVEQSATSALKDTAKNVVKESAKSQVPDGKTVSDAERRNQNDQQNHLEALISNFSLLERRCAENMS